MLVTFLNLYFPYLCLVDISYYAMVPIDSIETGFGTILVLWTSHAVQPVDYLYQILCKSLFAIHTGLDYRRRIY